MAPNEIANFIVTGNLSVVNSVVESVVVNQLIRSRIILVIIGQLGIARNVELRTTTLAAKANLMVVTSLRLVITVIALKTGKPVELNILRGRLELLLADNLNVDGRDFGTFDRIRRLIVGNVTQFDAK